MHCIRRPSAGTRAEAKQPGTRASIGWNSR